MNFKYEMKKTKSNKITNKFIYYNTKLKNSHANIAYIPLP